MFAKFVETQLARWGPGNPQPTKEDLRVLTWIFRAVIIFVLPSAGLIYRSRLIGLAAF